jgi:hypothetical protein
MADRRVGSLDDTGVADRAGLDMVRQTAPAEWLDAGGRVRRGLLFDLSFSDPVKMWLRRYDSSSECAVPLCAGKVIDDIPQLILFRRLAA